MRSISGDSTSNQCDGGVIIRATCSPRPRDSKLKLARGRKRKTRVDVRGLDALCSIYGGSREVVEWRVVASFTRANGNGQERV